MSYTPIISLILVVLVYYATKLIISKSLDEIKQGQKIIQMLLSALTGLAAGLITQTTTQNIWFSLIVAIVLGPTTYFVEKFFLNIITPIILALSIITSTIETVTISLVLVVNLSMVNYEKTKNKKKFLEISTGIVLILVTLIKVLL